MTPLILVILAAMWAAVLLPPYLRDRNQTRAAGRRGAVRDRIDALASSFSGGRSRLPVRSSGRSPGQVPLPHGAKQPVGAGRSSTGGSEPMPHSSAVQILGADGHRAEASGGPVTRLRSAGSASPVEAAAAERVPTPHPDTPIRKRSASSLARQRRRDVLHVLMGLAGISLVATVALGGQMLYMHLLADAALITYVYLLVQRRKVSAEREMKVAFLPHGGNGASATALLEQGGGWNPGTSGGNVRVLRAEAN